MLESGKMVGFVLTSDYDAARAFYEGTLGFRFISLDQFALVVEVGGHLVRISKVPEFQPLPSTVLGWEVDNIVEMVAALQRSGVTFEQYPFMEDPKSGIWTAPSGDRVAWFKDPSGNVLSLSQRK